MRLGALSCVFALFVVGCSKGGPSVEGTWSQECEGRDCHDMTATVAGLLHPEGAAQCSVVLSNVSSEHADVEAHCDYYTGGEVLPGHVCTGSAQPTDSDENVWHIEDVACTTHPEMHPEAVVCKTPTGEMEMRLEFSGEDDGRRVELRMRIEHAHDCTSNAVAWGGNETYYNAELPFVESGE